MQLLAHMGDWNGDWGWPMWLAMTLGMTAMLITLLAVAWLIVRAVGPPREIERGSEDRRRAASPRRHGVTSVSASRAARNRAWLLAMRFPRVASQSSVTRCRRLVPWGTGELAGRRGTFAQCVLECLW